MFKKELDKSIPYSKRRRWMKKFVALLALIIVLLAASGCPESKFPHGQQACPPDSKECKEKGY